MFLATFLFFLLSTILTLCGVLFHDPYYEWYECVCCIISYVFHALWMLMVIIGLPAGRWSDLDFIKRVEAMQTTLDEQRSNKETLSSMERATLTKAIIRMNKDIAETQNTYTFWRQKLWSHPNLMKLKPIK